ncbi:MAG: bifunctional diguanylate cyclase/phosphodiesterase [Pyrinomonadaceae bacterium]|nr:bifunctional diguanylate cyclase/phosphodiesterase [Pyrinomonadaceae bacterium]MCX7638841.1 bifunctional diguanylate cyclase/phosphodiesterase [Pyrinomonadaceae bacterium]MDW8305023.1 bifunctional diguanylate cyclase/phosphodiesterase [Acidobacteriota bacterium]
MLTIAVLLCLVILAFISFLQISKLKKDFERNLELERKRFKEAEKQIVELKEKLEEKEEANKALRESREKLRRALYHDPLTNLPRRELFQENLKFFFEKRRASRFGQDFGVIICELGRLKKINEALGNIIGDKILKEAAERLKDFIRDGDFIARFEGTKFGIILSNCDESELKRILDLLIHKLQQPYKFREQEVRINPFFGGVLVSEVYSQANEVLRNAELALQDAKEKNRNYAIFSKEMHSRLLQAHEFEIEIQNALKKNEFTLYFQPIVSLQTLLLSGFEVLIRWNHPKRGLVPPSEFISFSEKVGLIEPITYWILRQACKKLFYWQDLMPELTISVNLSGTHFSKDDLFKEVEKIIYESNITPSSLKLELTESEIMEDAEKAVETLKKFKALGTQIMIDDFGTGYSSLSYLHKFSVDTLKIDRSFVSGIEESSENAAIVRTIVSLAKGLGLSVVAEGIENIHQLEYLRSLSCQMGQGFLFSKPLPAEKAEKLLFDKVNWQHLMGIPSAQKPFIFKEEVEKPNTQNVPLLLEFEEGKVQ